MGDETNPSRSVNFIQAVDLARYLDPFSGVDALIPEPDDPVVATFEVARELLAKPEPTVVLFNGSATEEGGYYCQRDLRLLGHTAHLGCGVLNLGYRYPNLPLAFDPKHIFTFLSPDTYWFERDSKRGVVFCSSVPASFNATIPYPNLVLFNRARLIILANYNPGILRGSTPSWMAQKAREVAVQVLGDATFSEIEQFDAYRRVAATVALSYLYEGRPKPQST